MPLTRSTERARWLAPQEIAFLAFVILAWAVLVLSLGKDTSWDFRNYHWYIPYAYLNHRMGFDVAVAHQATFYNPTLDIPFYLLATHLPAWIALGILGMVQGSNVIPLYLIARSILIVEEKRLVAGIIALLCMLGGLSVTIAGTTYYDNVMSVFVLSGLAAIICNRELLANGTILRGVVIAGIAGFVIGMATGLKLPVGIYAVGFGAALMVLPGDASHRSTRVAAGIVGGVLGLALVSFHWWIVMDHVTGNPLFPYFNQYFKSPLALNASYRDERFLPSGFAHVAFYPLLFTLDWRVADDLQYADIRVCLAYIALILTVPILVFAKRSREPLVSPQAAYALFAFAGAAYVVWIAMFAIYRYIITLEMLSSLLVVCAVGLWPLTRRAQLSILGVLGVLALATMRPGWLPRAPVDDPYVQVIMPTITHPDHSMVLMAGEAPMGFLVPSLPPKVPVLRIDGWMIQPQDGSKLTAATMRRVHTFTGDIYLIANQYEIGRAVEALKDYGLQMRYLECEDIQNNLAEPYKFCPVERLTEKTP
jgi:hypothetical protein